MRKAPGPEDDITTKMFVAAGGREVTEITNLANMMYSEGRFPEQMYKSIFITLPKENGTAKCEKHRTISCNEPCHKTSSEGDVEVQGTKSLC